VRSHFGPSTGGGERLSVVSVVLNTFRNPLYLKGLYQDGTGFPAAAISAHTVNPRRIDPRQVEWLKEKNEMLCKHGGKKWIFHEPEEKSRLMKLGQGRGGDIKHLFTIVSYNIGSRIS